MGRFGLKEGKGFALLLEKKHNNLKDIRKVKP